MKGDDMEAGQPRKEYAVVGQGSIFDGIAYWVTLIGVYLMVGGLMLHSGKEKLFDSDGNAPQGIKEQFANTFIDTFPGTDAAWITLGILEFAVGLILIASLIRLEFLPHREKSLLQVGLAVALLTFAVMAFGQTVTNEHAGVASLYTYFGSTVVILILVSLMPPNRPDRWLSLSGRPEGTP